MRVDERVLEKRLFWWAGPVVICVLSVAGAEVGDSALRAEPNLDGIGEQ